MCLISYFLAHLFSCRVKRTIFVTVRYEFSNMYLFHNVIKLRVLIATIQLLFPVKDVFWYGIKEVLKWSAVEVCLKRETTEITTWRPRTRTRVRFRPSVPLQAAESIFSVNLQLWQWTEPNHFGNIHSPHCTISYLFTVLSILYASFGYFCNEQVYFLIFLWNTVLTNS